MIRPSRVVVGRLRWPLIAAIALLVGSSIPLPASHNPDFGIYGPDKVLHATGHLALTASLISAVVIKDERPTVHTVLVAIFLSSIYGVGTELLQERIPGREFESGDLLAGLVGSACGGLWWYLAN